MTDHDELAARVMAYFDGELPAEEHDAVLAHLAGCADCQTELGDAVGLEAALAVPARAAPRAHGRGDARVADIVPITSARRSRRTAVIVAFGLVAAAAVALLVWRMRPTHGDAPVGSPLALASTRAIEARFTAAPFAAHREYAVVRGTRTAEPISLDALAALERQGDRPALIAALASAGDLARARQLAAETGVSGTDRAALALADGAPETALEGLAGEAGPAAAWNRALAARDLQLPMLARSEFARVVAAHEPGWADEAAKQIAVLDAALATRAGFMDLLARGKAMVAWTGPVLSAADVTRHSSTVRIYFFDALRTADAAGLTSLGPLADALDRSISSHEARRALDRVAALAPAARARFRDRYRALAASTLSAVEAKRLVEDLAAAGPTVADLWIGALVWTRSLGVNATAARRVIAEYNDPWFDLQVAHEEIGYIRQTLGPAAAVDRAGRAADACPALWAYRCGQLALDAAQSLADAGRSDDAIGYARRARDSFAAAAAMASEDSALTYLGELARYRDRRALARATFEESELRTVADCVVSRFARVGRARLAFIDARLDEARALLPPPTGCDAPVDELALVASTELARASGRADDRASAEAWIAAARASTESHTVMLAEVAVGRLAAAADPKADGALKAWVAAHPLDPNPDDLPPRSWASAGIIDAAGERGDWAGVADAATAELGRPAIGGCLVVASLDEDREVVAARDASGAWHGRARRIVPTKLDVTQVVPAEVASALASCTHVSVIARPPLHGRSNLLPAAMPWAFVGGPPHAVIPRPPRTVIVTDVTPPESSLQLPRLAAATYPATAQLLSGATATPARVLAEAAEATYLEINAHGVADIETADASFLALSPDSSGKFMLTAADVRAAKLRSAPVVVLAACRGAQAAPYLYRRWSLPDAFITAGARAVIATDLDIPDPQAAATFAALRERVERGEDPVVAVAALRAAAPGTWIARIAVFE